MSTRTLIFASCTIGFLLIAGTGCVSSSAHRQLSDEHARLNRSFGELETQRDELLLELASAENDVSHMRDTYESLEANLRHELESGMVELQQLRDGIRLNLSQDVLFQSGSTALDASGRRVIAKVARQIPRGATRVDVEGHSDNVMLSPALKGRWGTNWELAGARAANVVRLLQEEGLQGHRLNAVSKGPFTPLVSNDSEEGRRRNRRIEIRFYPEKSSSPAKRAD